jgi:hypothetical protein
MAKTKIKKGGSGIHRVTMGWGVAVAGWEWYESIRQFKAVRMVPVTAHQCQY